MKTYKEYDIQLPDYSLCYLINGDSSGLESHDIEIIDRYMAKFYREAQSVNGSVVISPNDDDEPYFTWRPAFGLACNVVDTKIIILIKE